MDAVTYLKTLNKFCHVGCCEGCPISMHQNKRKEICTKFMRENPTEAVAIVEKWLAEHPPVTYASKMREVFPKIDINNVCLATLSGTFCDKINRDCRDCNVCWNREYGSLEGESK